MSVAVMQAAGHPDAQAHRLLLLRCILHLGPVQTHCMVSKIWYNSKDMVDQLSEEPTTSCPDHLAHLLASSPVVTGWPGPLPAKPSSEHSSTAGGSSGLGHTTGTSSSNSGRGRGKVPGKSTGQGGKGSSTACPKDLALVNSLAHVAQALCAVLGRQEEGLIMDQLISTISPEPPWCSRLRPSNLSVRRMQLAAFLRCAQRAAAQPGPASRHCGGSPVRCDT
ncbi:hypothetical protein V8C86DRAFT_2477546, partial [Haematococcus lacustris]